MINFLVNIKDLILTNGVVYVLVCIILLSLYFVIAFKKVGFEYETLIVGGAMILLGLLIGFGTMHFLIKPEPEPTEINPNAININFENDSENDASIRYKYILNYETTDEMSTLLVKDNPVFSVILDGEEELIMYPKEERELSIPSVSEVIKLKAGETHYSNMLLTYPNENIKENIRFEVTVVVEKLIENKWSPYYQIIFMERGPYWSLNKGPVEFLPQD